MSTHFRAHEHGAGAVVKLPQLARIVDLSQAISENTPDGGRKFPLPGNYPHHRSNQGIVLAGDSHL